MPSALTWRSGASAAGSEEASLESDDDLAAIAGLRRAQQLDVLQCPREMVACLDERTALAGIRRRALIRRGGVVKALGAFEMMRYQGPFRCTGGCSVGQRVGDSVV